MNEFLDKIFFLKIISVSFFVLYNDFILFQRTCPTLFEWRIQINWLQEFRCAAFIATGKPWMEYGKWHTTQVKEYKKENNV